MSAKLEHWNRGDGAHSDFHRVVSPDDLARINHARNLLLNPHYRVSEIAAHAGFDSMQIFEEDFLRATGQSVWEYRENLANSFLWNVHYRKQTPRCGGRPRREMIYVQEQLASVAAGETSPVSAPTGSSESYTLMT